MNTNPNAKRILCFGDSYTWGYIPASNHERFPVDQRWTGVLQMELGIEYEIIEEGLNSRTLSSDDKRPGKEGRNGLNYLIPCLDSHDPIDVVVLMLGTNELKDSFTSTLEEISRTLEEGYVKTILNRKSQFRNTAPKLLLVSPPILDLTKEYAKQRYSMSIEKNQKIAIIYEEIANQNKCIYFNSSKILKVGDDGVHFDKENHRKFGETLARIIEGI